MTDENNNKWRETIEKLMRKAEDPATPQAERDALVDKITYLMAKFGIEADMLRAQEQRPLTAEMRRFIINAPYIPKKLLLLNVVAKAFGCFMVQNRDNKSASVFGTQEDIERVFMLYYSLVLQMTASMAYAQSQKPAWEHGKTFNNSFVIAFVDTVCRRIQEAARRAKEDVKNSPTGNGMELVLVNKAQMVRNLVNEHFPHLKNVYTSMSSRSASGSAAGTAAGQRADIGGTRVGGVSRRAIGT